MNSQATGPAEPIAIVGHACVLPGALGPERLWTGILARHCAIGPVPAGRWRLDGADDPSAVQGGAGPRAGGYVDGFDAGGCAADPLTQWVRHVLSEALREAGRTGPQPRAGLVLGTLAYPTESAQRLLEEELAAPFGDRLAWRRRTAGDERELRYAARPARLAAEELGLGLGGFALDAACASGLVAVKLACDRLRDGAADLMLAAAVNRADNLLVHNAFHALSALSPTGTSRPLDRSADGLVPAEGAAAVALMRLSDALREDVEVLGVIRGVGLSNDGRTGGPLAPGMAGQLRAMRAAYAEAAVAPETVTLLECHATGTPVGDLMEARSAAELFAGAPDLPFGSVKSNLGHPLAVGGLAGLVKVLGALRAGVRPPTLGIDEPLEVLRGTPLRPLTEAEEWPGTRRAAVSAFGFGGANAHLVVDAFVPGGTGAVPPPVRSAPSGLPLAVVGRAACRSGVAELAVTGLAVPPSDLARAGTAQLRVLAAAQSALRGLELPRERTMVVVGGAEDQEVARYGLRWRLPAALGPDTPAARLAEVREACAPAFDLAAVLGTMPNLLAHRVNALGDLGGQGLVVFADDDSGRVALGLAARALRAGEADAAVVAHADGVAVVLRRLADASDGPGVTPLPDDAALADLVGPLDGTRIEVFAGATRADALAALDAGRPAAAACGPARLVLAGADRTAARAWLAGDGPRPDGAAYRDGPLGGEVAFVFTNGSAAYPGMGDELLRAVPGLGEPPADAADVLGQIHATTALAAAHVRLTREVLGLRPAAAIGYSSGEVSALAALGVWPDLPRLVEQSRTGDLFRTGLTGEHRVLAAAWGTEGRWRAYLVPVDADRVRGALEPRVHLMARNAPGVSVIGGDPRRCEAVLGRLGTLGVPLTYDIAAHVPELDAVHEELVALHRLPTVPVSGVRFYRGVTGDYYREPDSETAARAVAAQAVGSLDFVRTVENAWADGARVFVEHGPQGLCSGWIGRILDGRPHLAVALDAPANPLGQLRTAVAELLAAGVEAGHHALFGGVTGPVVRFPLEREPLRLPELAPGPERMAPAPALPRVTAAPRPEEPDEPFEAAEPAEPRAVPVPSGHAGPWTSQPPVPVAVAIPAPVDPAHAGDTLRAVVAAHHAAVSTAHTDFLRVQAQAQRRFLDGRANALTALLGAFHPAAPPAPATAPPPVAPPALWDRDDLERLASGAVSELFGPAFAVLDDLPRQTRMPMPPLLLADRVTRIDGEPASMGTGAIHTETDVEDGAWYLDPAGRMAPGPFVEAGQADLLLISWLGVDLDNRDDRVYRLLGCRLVFHGPLPTPGERLRYEIAIDHHVEYDGVRLFFFRYEAYSGDRLRLTLSDGQAGHFTTRELASSGGITWTPQAEVPPPGRSDPPVLACERRRFGPGELRAFTEGRPADCFGPGWERTGSHRATPRLPGGALGLLEEVTAFDPAGGPWGRGYLSARTTVHPDDWYFPSHFLNDPCMPGTLMLEAALQALSFHLAALGHTLDRDGWRFEPVPDSPYDLRCRGQVTPATRSLEYRVFVREVAAGPYPAVHADLLCLADGLPAFHVANAAVRLVPPGDKEHDR